MKKANSRDMRIKELFKQGCSPQDISNKLNIEINRVLKTLKNTYKVNKERDIELFIKAKEKLRQEIIKIHRAKGFFDSLGLLQERF